MGILSFIAALFVGLFPNNTSAYQPPPTPEAAHTTTNTAPTHTAPTHTATPRHRVTVAEDSPRWNCLTMGNHLCGPTYVPASPTIRGGTLAGCLVKAAGTHTITVCPDGRVIRN